MTTAVVWAPGGKVKAIGSDGLYSVGSEALQSNSRKEPKWFLSDDERTGVCFAGGIHLRYMFDVAVDPRDFNKWDVNTTREFLVEQVKVGGFKLKEDEGNPPLIDIYTLFYNRDGVWFIGGDLVPAHINGVFAIGSGSPYALGAFSVAIKTQGPGKAMRVALETAAKFDLYSAPPFFVKEF